MKLFGKIICSSLIVVCAAFAFAGCDKSEADKEYAVVTVNKMNGENTETINVRKGIEIPESGFTSYPKR